MLTTGYAGSAKSLPVICCQCSDTAGKVSSLQIMLFQHS